MVKEMLDQFHETHPNIHVYYSLDPPSDSFNETMMANFQANTAPDVFQGCCSYFPIWAQQGYTLDLKPYVSDLDRATIDDWDPAQYQALFQRDGTQFGLPKYHGALALFYNKELFDQQNTEYPDKSWSHQDYLAAMKKLTGHYHAEGQPDVWGSMLDVSWDRLQVHVNAWGGHFVDPDDPKHCLMAEPQALDALEWLRTRMVDERVMADPLDVQKMSLQDAFLSNKLAMSEDGSWALKTILSGAKARIGVAPLPAGPARRATLATTDGFGIYAGTKYPDAAWELVKFLTGKDYGRAMAKAHFLQPARASLIDEWVDLIRQQYPEKTKDMDIAAFADGHINHTSVVAEIFSNQAEAQKLTSQAFEKIFVLGQAPVASITDVCQAIDKTQ